MRKCNTCGTEVPDNATSCPTCGGDLVSPEANQQATPPEPQKKKGKAWKIIVAIIAILIILSAISSCSNSCSKAESSRSEDWPTGQLAQMIPSMDRKCKSVNESKDRLSITVTDRVSKSDYDKYVSECEELGFTVDAVDDTKSYNAYNSEGYRLNVRFSGSNSDNQIDITLDAPKVNGELVWPAMGLASKLPNPEKAKGSIEIDSSSQFTAYVGEMSKADFSAYIDKCIEAGFNVDHSKKETSFSAKNAQGDSLQLEYQGFNTMYISMYAFVEKSSSSSASSASPSNEAAASSAPAAASSSIKEVMDEYEAFMDSYIAFMEKYNSGSDPAGMALDYAKFTADYASMLNKINSMDTSSLSESDYQYYMEVVSRVNEKLANAAL